MASFQPALDYSLGKEDRKWELVPGDKGLETVWGWSRAAHPNDPVWPLVDAVKAAHPGVDPTPWINADQRIVGLICIGYRREYWQPSGAAGINDQLAATLLFDMAVNMGPARACTYLQRAVNVCGRQQELAINAQPGADTLAAANAIPAELLQLALRAYRAKHYVDLGEACPADAKFMFGWLRRAFS